jgi:cephalosporin hydroxylase
MADDEVVREFHQLFYDLGRDRGGTWSQTRWLGVPCLKSPFDAWVYQEIVYRTRPDVIVECGTAYGGSALFLSSICSLIGNGRVITVDVSDERHHNRPHDLVTYVRGSSTAPATVEEVRAHITPDDSVMVILDSDHHAPHVLEELRLYGPLVTAGQYLIVEDTNLNHEVRPQFGPGPAEAVEQFLSDTDDFTPDPECEKFLMSFNHGGFLLRR